jgi:mRNA-degrading endonuclease RelE of RelBE toxin-antitoxin system
MTPRTAFEIVYSPVVRQHLGTIERKHYALIREAIENQLRNEPDRETRNRKPLKRPAQSGAQWELRCGPNNCFRIFYTVGDRGGAVTILAIGEKQGSRLMIGGEEIEL